MPVTTGLIVGGGMIAGGAVAGGMGGKDEARAQGEMANAQRNEYNQQSKDIYQELSGTVRGSSATPDEIQSMERMIALYEKQHALQEANIQRTIDMAQKIDPVAVEAATQSLQAMQGKQTAAMNPMVRQREQQRAKLQQQLQEELGGGYASSTAGQAALDRFDMQTGDLYAGAQQQQALSFGQLAMSGRPDVGGTLAQSASVLGGLQGNILNAQGNIQNRILNARTNMNSILAGRNPAAYAGSEYVNQLGRARSTQKVGGMIAGGGAQIAGASMGARGGRGGTGEAMGEGTYAMSQNPYGNSNTQQYWNQPTKFGSYNGY